MGYQPFYVQGLLPNPAQENTDGSNRRMIQHTVSQNRKKNETRGDGHTRIMAYNTWEGPLTLKGSDSDAPKAQTTA